MVYIHICHRSGRGRLRWKCFETCERNSRLRAICWRTMHQIDRMQFLRATGSRTDCDITVSPVRICDVVVETCALLLWRYITGTRTTRKAENNRRSKVHSENNLFGSFTYFFIYLTWWALLHKTIKTISKWWTCLDNRNITRSHLNMNVDKILFR